CQQYNTAPWTF
nr:immunoglobulin light chain junction region [Macaca mulatta]MOW53772.1 immunoglobulin light chain junction region [Macaca mulatta]MOW61827.1 immunoglobulin light chain junction region [Macaca mulatta]MOW61888.1 immunoglobulin light chain junction region [Macaca mulatta]MOW61981.1 immunoglobulin light chain junction region [Macaca mulatta]